MTLGEAAAAASSTLIMAFVIGLLCLYLTMPDSYYTFLKLPRSLQDLRLLRRDELEKYTSEYTAQVLVGYCLVYFFMQTLMSPGTVFLSLLAGALFGVLKGLVLVVCTATVAKRKENLLNYMLFLRLTPTLPRTFINVALPMVDVPFHISFLATLIGLIPAPYGTVRAGLALGGLKTLGDLYEISSISTLFLIGIVSAAPTLMSKSKS